MTEKGFYGKTKDEAFEESFKCFCVDVESIKADILNVLGGMRLTTGHAFFDNCRVYEQDRGVFEEYSLFQEDYGQYFLWPYAAFRFKFEN